MAGKRKDTSGAPDARAGRRSGRGRRRGVVVLTASLVALAAVYAGALTYLSPADEGRELSFERLTRIAVCSTPASPETEAARAELCEGVAQRLDDVRLLDEDARITGRVVSVDGGRPQRFWAAYPRSDVATNDLLRTLVAARSDVAVDTQATKAVVRFLAQFLLPLVILDNLFALVIHLSKGGAGPSPFLAFGRIGDKRVARSERSRTTFADVAAADEAVVELGEVRDYLRDPRTFERMGALPPKGVLLTGPPGCGKTLLARAVAGEAEAAFFSISGSEFVESLVGVGAARVRDLFARARACAPALIFIDELDAAGRQRGTGMGGGNDEREQTLNELLVQMDGFSPTEGLVVIGATNRADILDPALLRAGRFDRHVTVDRPDLEGRLAILHLHAENRRLGDPGRDLGTVARRTPGFTGADLANVLNEAALLAVRAGADAVDGRHLEEAVERVLSGPRRRARLISDDEKRRIAYHEAGHAVVAAAVGLAGSLEKVSVVSRGRGVGHVAVVGEDKAVVTRPEMESQVAVAMAGIAAEELVFGHPSTGSEQDLERATATARDMAGRFGMSSRLGRARVLHQQGEVFLGRDYLSARDVSQPTLEHLDAEVRRILDAEEARAAGVLKECRAVLDALAGALVERETVEGTELHTLLGPVEGRADLARASASNGRPRRRRTADQAPA